MKWYEVVSTYSAQACAREGQRALPLGSLVAVRRRVPLLILEPGASRPRFATRSDALFAMGLSGTPAREDTPLPTILR